MGEGLGISTYADVEAHVPHVWFGDSLGNGEPYHEVAEEVEEGTHGEDNPGRGDFVDEAGEDTEVAA